MIILIIMNDLQKMSICGRIKLYMRYRLGDWQNEKQPSVKKAVPPTMYKYCFPLILLSGDAGFLFL